MTTSIRIGSDTKQGAIAYLKTIAANIPVDDVMAVELTRPGHRYDRTKEGDSVIISIEFETDNSAFHDAMPGATMEMNWSWLRDAPEREIMLTEIARILIDLAAKLTEEWRDRPVMDINGNKVGTMEVNPQ